MKSDIEPAEAGCLNTWSYEVRQAYKSLFPKSGVSRLLVTDMSFRSLDSVDLSPVKSLLLTSYSKFWKGGGL